MAGPRVGVESAIVIRADEGAVVELSGAINETLGARLVVAAARRGSITAVRAGDLRSDTGVIAAEQVRMFRVAPVALTRYPGWHIRAAPPGERRVARGDVLIPLEAPRGGLPLPVSSEQPGDFWMDVEIPKGTAPGAYRGEIAWISGGREAARVELRLTVWPFVLPDADPIPFLVEVDHRPLISDRGDAPKALLATMAMLRRHRLTPVLPFLSPEVRTDARGRPALEWSRYDAAAGPALSGEAFADRLPVRHWPLPAWALGPRGEDAPGGRAADTAFARSYLSLAAAHFEEREWLDRAYAVAPEGMPEEPFAAAVRAAHDELPLLAARFPQDMGPFGWVDAPAPPAWAVDIWMPRAQFFDPAVMRGERAAGRRTWLRLDRPPFSGTTSVHGSEADVLVLGWQASRLEAEVVHVGCANAWPKRTCAAEECLGADEETLIFPGAGFGMEEPVASLRLKLLRRTVQDAALAGLVSARGLDHVTQALRAGLMAEGGTEAYRTSFVDGRRPAWRRDAASYEQARLILGGELAERTGGLPSDESAVRRRQQVWRQFMLGGRGVQVMVDGVRLRAVEGRESLAAEVEARLTLLNEGRVPIRGAMAWASLPEGWQGVGTVAEVVELSPGGSQRMTLAATGLFLGTSDDGVQSLALQLMGEEGPAWEGAARLAALAAPIVARGPRIDGDLSDWPGGTVNVGGDFLLVSRDTSAVPGPGDRPRRRTTVFVLRDESALYVAVHAQSARSALRGGSRRPRADYADMVPVGEELVEIVLDPLHSGARTPESLYHLVIRPSGAFYAEVGLRQEPPCGRSRPWAAEIDAAAEASGDRWTAEARIPFAAFGGVAAPGVFWGFNVARFDAEAQEYSTWSGAAHHPFDPLSLGNLYLP